MTTKKNIHAPIVTESGRIFEKVWRVKHIPSGAFFKPGRGFSTTEGRLAKTYSRKPSLGIIGPELDHVGKPKLIYVHITKGHHPRSEFKVIEYIIAESGIVYDK